MVAATAISRRSRGVRRQHRPVKLSDSWARAVSLRDHGVLIVSSGNIVHNLRAFNMSAGAMQAYDWALEFDRVTADLMQSGDLAGLTQFQKLGGVATQAHPTYEHYRPLLYAAGAADGKEPLRMFNTDFQAASISMRSFVTA